MTNNKEQITIPEHPLLGSTVRVFLSEALLLPTGLITAAYLTRKLGPSGYGLLTLAAMIISWIEWTIASIFARATFKFVAQSEDWKAIGTTVVQLHFFASIAAVILLLPAIPPISVALNEPALALLLYVYLVDIPLFALAQAHRSILIGRGEFHQRAVLSAARWITRMILILVLVQAGFSILGAVCGSILATVVELILSRYYVRPPIFARSTFPVKHLWEYALPLFLFAFSMRIYEKLDLVLLKGLGGTAADAGIYGAAQNLSIVVHIFALSFSPLLLARLSAMLHRNDEPGGRKLASNALRAVVALFPFAAMSAGASREIVVFIFGQQYAAAAPVLSYLLPGAICLAVISVVTSILTARNRPGLTFALVALLVPLSFAGYFVFIPEFGAVAAAMVNAAVAGLGAVACLCAAYINWKIAVPSGTWLRIIFLSLVAYSVASLWPTPGLLLPVKLLIVSFLIVAGYFLLREFRLDDVRTVTQQPLIRNHSQ